MDRQRIDAAQATLNWQWELINSGTFAIRIAHDLLIFSEILEDYKEVGMQGFIFGKHYSVACPHGEMGDVHRSTFLAMITKEMFEAARNLGCNNWFCWVGSSLPDGLLFLSVDEGLQ